MAKTTKSGKALARSALKREAAILMKRAAGAGSTKMAKRLKSSGKMSGVVKGVATDGPQGPERKKYDNLVATTAVNTGTPFIASLTSAIAQGTAYNQRVGDRIKLKSVDLEMNVSTVVGASVTTLQANQVFMDVAIVWDKQPDAAVPGVTSIFTSSATNLTFSTVANLERFHILRRWNVCLDLAQGLSQIIKDHIPLDLGARFPDATGSPTSNDIYVVAITPNATASATNVAPSISYVARVSYTDQ